MVNDDEFFRECVGGKCEFILVIIGGEASSSASKE